jgi:hypothetical protein
MMGRRMAHLRYGNAHSNTPATVTWQSRVERGVLQDGFIPFGWQYDLLDNNSENPPDLIEPLGFPFDITAVPIVDNISGFTLLEIYNTMSGSMLSIEQQKSTLQFLLVPKGLTLADYNSLSAGYGF